MKSVRSYVQRVHSVEAGVLIDPSTGMPVGITGKILIGEPNETQAAAGFQSVDHLLADANSAFSELGLGAWIVLDRLDT